MILRRLLAGSSAAALPILFTLIAPSCTTDAYCFVCEQQSAAGGDAGSAGTGGGGSPNVMIDGGSGTGGTLNFGGSSNGGTGGTGPTCTADTENDPTNCGECGNECNLLGAYADCVGGECVIAECGQGNADLNMEDADGCEYVCPIYPPEDEICDGIDNDCDGEKDEDFDLTTLENCGSCGNNCALTNATVDCENVSQDPLVDNYQCVVQGCVDGYADIDQVNSNGCEYECPVWPPVDELCNALDDNCNGEINEGNPEGGQDCGDPCPGGNCRGLCEPGQTLCVGNGLVCVGGQGPEPESCDGEDNDCNGTDDNGFNLNTDILNCGACGNECDVPNAIATCVGGDCVVGSCQPGYADLNNNDADGCEHVCAQYPTSPEVCDGKDNNCDGVVDRVSVATPLTPPAGLCRQTGPCNGSTASCTSGAWRCNYPTINPNIEVNAATGALVLEETKCDDFDGDCDGQVDESFVNKNTPCSAGQGICMRTGTFECNGAGTGTQCSVSAAPGSAVNESCNGLDDDCDGQVDETAAQTGCTGVACSRATDSMVQVPATTVTIDGVATNVPAFYVYQYEASRPDAESTDVNNTRACSKSAVIPWRSVNRAAAEAACAAVKNSAGNSMHLCDEAQWQAACESNSTGTGTKWGYSTAEGTYESGVCNDRSLYADPEDPLDPAQAWLTSDIGTGSKQCRTTTAAGTAIYNMSGNVSEWTSTSEVVLGTTYYRVRGGSFLTYGPITACDKSFVLDQQSFQSQDLGFRCCSAAAP